ncbi:hypothetical protein [Brevundimonas sp. CEF1]|uniref:hypothetical protein n=1 Tax=Brevundimonas sp. CEF1 TaxID=3442642 RepID=UPI003F50EA91
MSDDEAIELPETTVPAGLGASVQGFTSEEGARELGSVVLEWICGLGRLINLSTLDGVTIAIDYDAALASLDRGLDGLRPLSRSNSEEMQGVAMSPAVLRDGRVKTHLIFNAGPIAALAVKDAPEEDVQLAIGIIAHECAHVQITAQKEAAIPDARFGARIEGYERGVLFQLAEVCWDEYAACRISAPFAKGQNERHAETVAGVVAVARDRSNAAIRSYRRHADLNRLVGEAGPALCEPMKAVAYLLGGMDGDEETWTDRRALREAVEAAGYGDVVDELHHALRALWDTQDQWDPTLDTFGPLLAIGKRVFEAGGIFFRSGPDGSARIDVPFTLDTI